MLKSRKLVLFGSRRKTQPSSRQVPSRAVVAVWALVAARGAACMAPGAGAGYKS
ncbi:hypothetical protein A2U01_0012164 [Trifolium medium]|uniref:Uncharacterized protein n=1 Tax=Trifolium medium TaxID=97028 RepID=A0A392MX11_9FABA|nr:hypothetical protein [Trifolium medium]